MTFVYQLCVSFSVSKSLFIDSVLRVGDLSTGGGRGGGGRAIIILDMSTQI